jgi:hypothetical protein
MPIDDVDLLALPIESAARLARVSVRRVRYWDEIALIRSSIKRQVNARSTVRLYISRGATRPNGSSRRSRR